MGWSAIWFALAAGIFFGAAFGPADALIHHDFWAQVRQTASFSVAIGMGVYNALKVLKPKAAPTPALNTEGREG